MQDDLYYMRRAYDLAWRGLYTTYPNPAVGCVLVRDGQIIGEGYHQRAGEDHAEVKALRQAGNAEGATAYVTLEPCSHYGRTPPCALRLLNEKVARVVYACSDPDPRVQGGGHRLLCEGGVRVESGILEQECRFLNRAFMHSVVTSLPYVTVKIGMSLDAKSALSSGESKWITSPDSRMSVQDLRAKCDVLVTGSGTVLSDNPGLDVRYGELAPSVQDFLHDEQVRQPLKVVLDTRGRLDPGAFKLFMSGQTLWCVGGEELSERRLTDHVVRLTLPRDGEHLDFKALLSYLGSRQYRRVLVEAGATLTGEVVRRYAQELYVFMAPRLLGETARGAFALPSPDTLQECRSFRLHSLRALPSSDVRLHYLLDRG